MRKIIYKYLAITDNGQKKIGKTETLDKKFNDNLKYEKLTLVKVNMEFVKSYKLSDKELYMFAYEMYLMLNSGINIIEALDIISDRTKHKNMSNIASELKEKLLIGLSLEASIEFLNCFPIIFRGLVKSAEESGDLEKIFNDLYLYYKEQDEMKSKIKSSLSYPIFLIIILFISVFIIFSYIIPIFIDIYKEFDISVPKYIKIFEKIEIFKKNISIKIFLILTLFSFSTYIIRNKFKTNIDRLKMKYIKIYNLKKMVEITKLLSILLDGQIQFYRALIIIKDFIDNDYLKKTIENGLAELKSGSSFSDFIYENNIFPDVFYRFIYIGETTGTLDKSLNDLHFYLKKKYDFKIEIMTKMIEPILLIIISIFIGIIATIVISPMQNLMNLIL